MEKTKSIQTRADKLYKNIEKERKEEWDELEYAGNLIQLEDSKKLAKVEAKQQAIEEHLETLWSAIPNTLI